LQTVIRTGSITAEIRGKKSVLLWKKTNCMYLLLKSQDYATCCKISYIN